MIKYLVVPVLVLLEFAWHRLLGIPWLLFDPLLAAAMVYTFLHHLDARGCVGYALWCGFWRDAFGMDVFGIYMMSYVLTVFGVAFMVRVLYRHNWMFVFPVVFAGQILNNHLVFCLRPFLGGSPSVSYARFFGRTFLQAFGTTLLSYPFFFLFKKCEPEFTE
jgi:cell shape-determining protein MreD